MYYFTYITYTYTILRPCNEVQWVVGLMALKDSSFGYFCIPFQPVYPVSASQQSLLLAELSLPLFLRIQWLDEWKADREVCWRGKLNILREIGGGWYIHGTYLCSLSLVYT